MKDYFRVISSDIQLEILSRLSARDLQRLKCVSKEWNSIISDRLFVQCQLKNAEIVAGFFFQERFRWCDDDIKHISYITTETKSTVVYNTVLNFLPESVVILSSCNGLICCRSSFPSLNPVLYVCNPFNKEWTSIKWSSPSKRTSIALSFDPSKIPIGDSSTNFKLVSVYQTEAKTETEDYDFVFGIYLSETGKWKRSREICQCKHNLFKNKGVFADGLLYWLTDGNQIIMFDPQLELSCLIAIPLPPTQFCIDPEMCIGESEGKLHYVLLSEDGLQLWVLEDHFASLWDLKLSTSLNELERENPDFLYNVAERLSHRVTSDTVPWIDLLAFKDGVLFTKVSTNVYSYNFKSKKMKKLCNLSALGMNSMYFPIVVPYTMSLTPLRPV